MGKRTALHETVKYPTSLIVRGADALGIEIAKTLLEQGGFVVMVDEDTEFTRELLSPLKEFKTFVLLDLAAIDHLDSELRRLDYVFYFQHKSIDLTEQISTQEFLQYSNYLDQVLDLTAKFDAKFLLTTAIKAHQMVLASSELDWNFGPQAQEKHSVYTEMEIQRYGESLVKEYQEKVGIDARVVRLGVLLGKDLELHSNTTFVQLLLQAIKGDNLLIPNDGLETDFYVHYLDAAYGIIKAQFSMNTKGKIYTLANEEEISILSVAYKLLELEPQAKEIKFIQESENLPPLKLYKPAEHITKIGWKPRVSFERALAHSLEFMREQLKYGTTEVAADSESESDLLPEKESKKGVKAKLFNFFFEAENKRPEEETNVEGALSRLIAERKNQEKARKGSIILANTKLREKVKKEHRILSLSEKIDNLVNSAFLSLKRRFEFLRNITITDFVFGIIALIAFGIVYFLVLAPILSLGKNIYLINNNLEGLAGSIEQTDFAQSREYVTNVNSNLEEVQTRLQSLQFLFDLTRNHQKYLEYQQLLANAVEYSSGYEDIFSALLPLGDYLMNFNPKISYRFSESNILSVSPASDYQLSLSQMRDNSLLMNVGIAKVKKSEDELLKQLDFLPQWLKDPVANSLVRITPYTLDYDYLEKVFNYLPQFLGLNRNQNIVVLMHDNARYTAGGGEIVGFILLQLNNGALKNIQVRNFADYLETSNQVSTEVFNEIKLLANTTISKENVQLSDLSLVSDEQVMYSSLETIIEAKESLKVDFMVGINLNILSNFLRATGEIEYQQVKFNQENLLQSINLLMGSNPTAKLRNEIILNIVARVFEKEFNNLASNYPDLLAMMAAGKESNDLRIFSSDLELANYVSIVNNTIKQVNDKLMFGLNYDQKSLIFSKYPVNTAVIKVKVNKNGTTEKIVQLSSSGADKLQNTFFCTPSGSKDFAYSQVTSDKVSTNFTVSKICNVFIPDEDLQYQVAFNTIAFENNNSSGYNYGIELQNSSGITSNFDIEFIFEENTKVAPEDPTFTKQGNTYIYSGVFSGKRNFNFKLD